MPELQEQVESAPSLLQVSALGALETVINRALALAPQGEEQLAEIGDKVFQLQCTAPQFNVYVQRAEPGVQLMAVYEGPVTTKVKGEASDFTELATAEDPAAALINGDLELEGDSAALINLQKIVSQLDIDWEAPLVDTLGDVVGHQVASALRGAFSWGQQAGNSLMRQLEEFIHEEARLSPPHQELEDFYSDIRQLRQRVERLQSRLQRLGRQLEDS